MKVFCLKRSVRGGWSHDFPVESSTTRDISTSGLLKLECRYIYRLSHLITVQLSFKILYEDLAIIEGVQHLINMSREKFFSC
jgi:hypothetical protein